MTALRILNLITWGIMLVYMLPGAWSATTAQARYGDPMRLACAATAFVFIGFNLYWVFGPRAHSSPTPEPTNAQNSSTNCSPAESTSVTWPSPST